MLFFAEKCRKMHEKKCSVHGVSERHERVNTLSCPENGRQFKADTDCFGT